MGLSFERINALLIRHLYLMKRSVPRLMDIFFWPIMELLLWGFISIYLAKLNITGVNIVTFLLGAVIFWDLLSQSQRAVSIAFLEEVWEKNFLNIFVTPLKTIEFIFSTVLIGFIKVIFVGAVMAILALILYHFNFFQFGFYLIPFVANLIIFGWTLGLFTTGIILRYGTSAQVLAFGLIFLIQPFSAVFYPVSSLPLAAQIVSYIIPSTYVFEGMREVVSSGTLPLNLFFIGLALNLAYMGLMIWYFHKMFAKVKEQGKLMKLDS